MQATTVKLHSLGYDQAKTYWIAALFVAGNVLLPQWCHLVPQGGVRWLPIYFFTLIAAYKYGWRAGMLTAVASPLINSALFGMPVADTLPPILFKSSLLDRFAQPCRISVSDCRACRSRSSEAGPSCAGYSADKPGAAFGRSVFFGRI